MLLAMLLQGAPAPRASVITSPDWERRPTAAELSRFFPGAAMVTEKSGRATVRCTVTVEGTLSACSVMEEYPVDYGFGDAALRMAPLFKMRPMTRDGQPVGGGTVQIPISFVLPQGATDTMTSSLFCYGHVAEKADREGAVEAWTAAHAWAGQLIGLAYKSDSKLAAMESSMARAHADAAAETNTRVRDRAANDCIAVVMKAAEKPRQK